VAKRRAGRRARGTGSVFWNAARQVWVARKTIGGVRVERWGRTQREAVDRLAAALPPDPASVTVSQWADRWRETLTVRLTAGDVERFTAQLLEGVAVTTARLIVAHLRVLLQAAVRAGLLASNPAGAARKPRHDPGPVATYTPAELQTIVGAAARYAAGGVIATLAATGMRVGEALALDVTDWDAAAGTLRIDRTYSRRFGVGPPKSRHSRRVITAPDLVRSVLDAARGGRSMGPLFPSSAGRRRSGRAVTRAWASLLRSAGLPRRKLHTLRHSVATAMIGAGVPLPDVAAYLGDTVATLAKTYLHRTRTDPVCAVNGYLSARRP
jgi:integrase